MSSDQPTYRREGERRKRQRKGENTDKNGLGAKVPGMTQPAAEVAASPPLAPAPTRGTRPLAPGPPAPGTRAWRAPKACHLPAGAKPAPTPSPGSNRRRRGWALALLVAAGLPTPLLWDLDGFLCPHSTAGLSPARPQCHRQPLASPRPPGTCVAVALLSPTLP